MKLCMSPQQYFLKGQILIHTMTMPPYALLFVYSILFLSLLNPLKVRFLREDFSSTHMHPHLYDLKNCLPHEFWMFKFFFPDRVSIVQLLSYQIYHLSKSSILIPFRYYFHNLFDLCVEFSVTPKTIMNCSGNICHRERKIIHYDTMLNSITPISGIFFSPLSKFVF